MLCKVVFSIALRSSHLHECFSVISFWFRDVVALQVDVRALEYYV